MSRPKPMPATHFRARERPDQASERGPPGGALEHCTRCDREIGIGDVHVGLMLDKEVFIKGQGGPGSEIDVLEAEALGWLCSECYEKMKMTGTLEEIVRLLERGHVRGGGYRDTELLAEDPSSRKLRPLSDEAEDLGGYSERETVSHVNLPTFEDVAGLEDVKEEARELILRPVRHPDLHERCKVQSGGGVLLYGPPGCGKTYVAKAIAGELGADFSYVSLSQILNKWFGESEQRVHALFERARKHAPFVIIFDEIDALGHERDTADGCMQTVLGQLLTELDGYGETEGIIVLGATNHPWNVDSALTRPGRFGRSIFIPPPDERARAELFKMYTVGRGRPVRRLDFGELAELTRGFSCADIAGVCERAVKRSLRDACEAREQGKRGRLRRAGMEDFRDVIRAQKPSISRWVEMVRGYMVTARMREMFPELGEFVKSHEAATDYKEVSHYA